MGRPKTRAADGLKPYRVQWGSPNNPAPTVDYAHHKDAKDKAVNVVTALQQQYGKYDRELHSACQIAIGDIRGTDIDGKTSDTPFERRLESPIPFIIKLWRERNE